MRTAALKYPAMSKKDDPTIADALIKNSAWGIWRRLTRSAPMGISSEGRDHMLKRHEIVVRIIEANSRRLRLENEINGLDIERRIAERDLSNAVPGSSEERIASLGDQIEQMRRNLSKLDTEREWLDEALADFDKAATEHPRSKPGNA